MTEQTTDGPAPMWAPVTYHGSLTDQHGTWTYAGLCACDICIYETWPHPCYVLMDPDGRELVHVARGSFHPVAEG